jgi:hypothetical protein
MERLVVMCNKTEFPLREFIERTLGPGRYYRGLADRMLEGLRTPRFTLTEDMISKVTRPADRIAFAHVEGLGTSIGHTAGLLRADFQ